MQLPCLKKRHLPECQKSQDEPLEQEPFRTISTKKQLLAYKHNGFWQCMDTIRDKEILEKKIRNKEHLEKK